MTRSRTFLVFVGIIFFVSVQAQSPGWLQDLKLAQSVAQNNNKLILVDFWATWCGPCKQMDSDVWSTQQAAAIKQNFVPVKIDIDAERSLALKYNVRSIPMLILMDHKGDVLHTYIGYSGKEDLISFISRIPSNATSLYTYLNTDNSKETFVQARGLGLAMQELSQQTDYEPLQRSFLMQSDKWFKRSNKLTTDENMIIEIELLGLLNDLYRNSSKKVLKEIEENRVRYETQTTQSLMYFVLVKVYKKNGDTAGYEYALSKLKEHDADKKYLSLLN
jgi:thiol-disulfide isomerase/thioredoxin